MIAPDTSVLVAGFVSTHSHHAEAVRALTEVADSGTLLGHTTAEAYSVLSAPSGIYRAEPGAVIAYLDQFLVESAPLPVPPGAYREALELLAGAGRAGGAVYDALIALAAREAGATLVSLDGRARPVYDLCRAQSRFLANV